MQSSSYVIPGTFQQMIVELIETPVKFAPEDNDRLPAAAGLALTGNPLDIAIQGAGFFQVVLPSGVTAYTRYGSFRLDDRKRLVTNEGNLVMPAIVLPIDADGLEVSPCGLVTAQYPGIMVTMPSGQFHLARFANVDGLIEIGGGLFQQSGTSGPSCVSTPNNRDAGTGKLLQSFLEIRLANKGKNGRRAAGNAKSDAKASSNLSSLIQSGLSF